MLLPRHQTLGKFYKKITVTPLIKIISKKDGPKTITGIKVKLSKKLKNISLAGKSYLMKISK